MTRLFAVLLLLPAAGFAQVPTIELTFTGSTSVSINAGDCARSFTGAWTWPTGSTTCLPLSIWATAGDCGDVIKDGDTSLKEEPSSTLLATANGTFTLKVADLPAFRNAGADGGVTCGVADIEKEHKICASTRIPTLDIACITGGQYIKPSTPVSVLYDTKPPTAPVIGDIVSLDTAVSVPFTVDDDTSKVHLQVKGPQDTDFSTTATVAYSASPIRVGGLTNGLVYSIRLVAEDSAGNQSAASEVKEGFPVQTDGLWDLYKHQGGDEPGGCHIAPASLSVVAGASLLALMLFRRRRVR